MKLSSREFQNKERGRLTRNNTEDNIMNRSSQSFDKKGRKKWEPVKHGMGDIMIPAEV